MSRCRLACGAISLLLVCGLAYCGDPEQDPLKKAADDWWGQISRIQKDRDKKLEALFKEMRDQDARLKALMKQARAAEAQGHGQFREAATQLEGSLKELGSDPKLKGAALIQLAGLYATMGEYDKAHARVQEGWQALRDYAATAPRDPWPLIDGAAAAAAILLQIERPEEAARCLDVGLALCQKPPPGLSLEGTPLPARCLLVKAELAHVTDDPVTARDCAERALESVRRLYPRPKPPHKYPVIAESAIGLNHLAMALLRLEQEPRAFELLREAQAIVEELFPEGHLSRAMVYVNLAKLYLQRGQEADALNWIEKAYDTYHRLFPEKQYPNGHPGLIQAVTTLGEVLAGAGSARPSFQKAALRMHAEALAMCDKYYTSAHLVKVNALLKYGNGLRLTGRIADAERHFQNALKMAHELYPEGRYPKGHPTLALCLLHVAGIDGRKGQYDEARKKFEQARETFRASPRSDHPYLSIIEQYLGVIAMQTNNRKAARDSFARALTLDQQQWRRFAWIASEADAMAFSQRCRTSYHGYLAVSREDSDADAYAQVWTAKAAVTRVLQERRAALRVAGEGPPQLRQRADELRQISARISQLLLNGSQGERSRREQLLNWMEKEDKLRRELEQEVLGFHRGIELDEWGPADLMKRLPPHSVFVDFVSYVDFLDRSGPRPRYAAFVLAPGGKITRVDLKFAQPINDAISAWRKAAQSSPALPSEALELQRAAAEKQAARLGELVWKPIAACFPADTRLVYLSPDAELTRFPFAALPGKTADSILLEEYTIAYVPHGPFLLDRITHPAPPTEKIGRFLALGDIEVSSEKKASTTLPLLGLAQRSGLASIPLRGADATPRKLCEALPRADFAYLTAHGRFEAEKLRAEKQQLEEYLSNWRFDGGPRTPGIGLGKRSPLSYVYLILARPTPSIEAGRGEENLTGSAIAQLSLDGLRLVVLSACETGVGEYTEGEGVQGLQRAFHLAGCANVVATLWRVDEEATRVLIDEFYRQLWVEKHAPLEALRLAQLEIYRHPERVPGVKRMVSGHAPLTLWAAFVYSGAGL
jgi:CHAT domain-containing protein/predicted negative regulator of RcsB-dependent stress response